MEEESNYKIKEKKIMLNGFRIININNLIEFINEISIHLSICN